MTIFVRVGDGRVAVPRSVFASLFDASSVNARALYLNTLGFSTISLDNLVELARKADIPYTLIFAPQAVVDAQLQRKADLLLAGVSKQAFSMNSRSRVRLQDVELIVKDILRKQELLKRLDDTLERNRVVSCLKGSRAPVAQDAATLRSVLGFTTDDLQAARNKQAALDLLIDRFEARQLLVSQSQQGNMPQRIPRGVKFSGMCVRDRKIPYIFLTGGDGGNNPEPAGRKVFTLVLLAVFVSRGKFAPATYDDHTAEPITVREYAIAAEVLMPAVDVRDRDTTSLDAVKEGADFFRVTPSAFTVRARAMGLISAERANSYLEELAFEFSQREKTPVRSPKPVNALRRYNGAELSRRMLRQLDRGRISRGEFGRVVLQNRIGPGQIHQFREAL